MCAPDGTDALFVYAYDSAAGVDVQLIAPLSSLATPGSTEITQAAGTWACANVYTPEGSWYYSLTHMTVTIASQALTVGEPLALSISNGELLYEWAGGPVVVDPGTGAQEPPPGSEPQFKLFLTTGDLSGVLGEWKESDPSGGGGTYPPT